MTAPPADAARGRLRDRTALDRHSYVPLYAQLKELLARRIRQGDLTAGEPFPSERELTALFGVSGITARRVMAELVAEGLIERRNGVGTFVREAPRKRMALLIFEFREAPEPGHRMIASAFGELVGGVAQAAWEAGAALSLAYLRDPAELARWLDQTKRDRTADGVLVRAAGDVTAEDLDLLDRAGLPYVLVKRHVPGREAACVVADERAAVRLSTHHLLALGHRQVGYVSSTQSTVLFEERLQGYRAALDVAGVRFDRDLVAPAPDFSVESGEEAAMALLGRARPRRPTALMVASDSMAIGAYRAAARLGLSIPADLSVASVDDIPEARALQPALTTARTSHIEFGVRATQLLLDGIESVWHGHRPAPRTSVIEPVLIIRASAAAPGAGSAASDPPAARSRPRHAERST